MSDVEIRWNELRVDLLQTADALDSYYKSVNVAKAVGSGISIVGSVAAIGLGVAALFTLGATLVPAYAAGVCSAAAAGGSLLTPGASVTSDFLTKQRMQEMQSKWEEFRNALGPLTTNLHDTSDTVKAYAKAGLKVFTGGRLVVQEIDAVRVFTKLASRAKEAASYGEVVKTVPPKCVLKVATKMPLFSLNAVALGLSIKDLILSSLELHRGTTSPAGELLRCFVTEIDEILADGLLAPVVLAN